MSSLRQTLLDTAHEFINSTSQTTSPTTGTPIMDADRLRKIRSPTYHHGFGHKHMVSKSPNLHPMSLDEWISHADKITSHCQTWSADVQNAWVDEAKKEVVLQVIHRLVPKGVQEVEQIDQEIIWILKMDEVGEKVVEGIEYLDAVAVKDLGELLRKAK